MTRYFAPLIAAILVPIIAGVAFDLDIPTKIIVGAIASVLVYLTYGSSERSSSDS
ncbi:hypothetical protein [Corynebacterium yudongzhengii]|nr:hypothetical protein [Corynebacterium yudongzhengii]